MKSKLLLVVMLVSAAFILASFQSSGDLITKDTKTTESPTIVREDRFFNTPDPFFEKTTIQYLIQEETFVYLYVVSPNFMDVIELVQGVHQPGVYKVDFFAYGMQNGTYTAFLKTNYSWERESMTKYEEISTPGHIAKD
jgi:hypothetical protein